MLLYFIKQLIAIINNEIMFKTTIIEMKIYTFELYEVWTKSEILKCFFFKEDLLKFTT